MTITHDAFLSTELSKRTLVRCLWEQARGMPGFEDALRTHPRAAEGTNQLTAFNAVFFNDFLGINGKKLHALRGLVDERIQRFNARDDVLHLSRTAQECSIISIVNYLSEEGVDISEQAVGAILQQEVKALAAIDKGYAGP